MNNFTVGPGDAYVFELFTHNPTTNVLQNADAPPSIAALLRNGVADTTFTPTVSNPATGVYVFTGTLPTLGAATTNAQTWGYGDRVLIRYQATVAGLLDYTSDSFRLDALVSTRNATTPPTTSAIAAAVEAALLNEGDGAAVQQALVDKIAAANPSLSGLTLTAIAQSVRDVALAGAAANSLGKRIADNLDAAMTSRSTFAGGAVASVTSPVTLTGAYDAAKAAATQTSVDAISGFVDTEVAAIKTVTDKLVTALELNGGVYRFTNLALALTPTGSGGGSAPTVDQIAAAILVTPANKLAVDGSNNVQVSKTGYALTGAYDAAKDAAQASDVTEAIAAINGHVDDQIESLALNVVEALMAFELETGFSFAEYMRGMGAVLLGKSSLGGRRFRNLGDDKYVLTATIDENDNRTEVVRDLS